MRANAAFGAVEEWRPFPDFEGLYEVSSLGRVKSLQRRGRRHDRIHGTYLDRYGYLAVGVSRNGKSQIFYVSRVVCRAFHGEPASADLQAAHLDGDRANARADNLRWCTKVENCSHKRIHGTHLEGSKHPLAKLTEADVLAMRFDRLRPRDAAERYGITPGAAWGILAGRTWRHLPMPQSIPVVKEERAR